MFKHKSGRVWRIQRDSCLSVYAQNRGTVGRTNRKAMSVRATVVDYMYQENLSDLSWDQYDFTSNRIKSITYYIG